MELVRECLLQLRVDEPSCQHKAEGRYQEGEEEGDEEGAPEHIHSSHHLLTERRRELVSKGSERETGTSVTAEGELSGTAVVPDLLHHPLRC